ncbi:MarR family transcriptional regulator [Candidatus Albibeggiatoa sp. nov. NOAA]|uniref:MarR family winged helix-turn-helix transcriptional regulator n=1 Tax=Candidatus Albibeggiatoa sp. nov. NOAA TaxID=3162724 RepID=UPI0033038DE7|nr:MarR family transcriptional regulator [Thiotrichaceae bacterium]
MKDKISADEMLARIKQHWPTDYHHVHELTIYLFRVRELALCQCNEDMKRFGLSSTEFDVLAALRNSPKPYVLTPKAVQQSMLITSGGLTKILYELERRKLITRSVQDHDKRSKLVHLTQAGQELVEQSMEAILKYDNEWISEVLEEGELKQLSTLLGKLNNRLEQRLFE